MKPRKLVYGIGINDADYAVRRNETIGYYANGNRKRKQVWICPYYRVWRGMLQRCYDAKYQEHHPAYKVCSVSEEWFTFSNFKDWMEEQDFEGMHLDKDILFEGSKVYSAETCVFVAPLVNTFINDQRPSRGEWLTGVCWDKKAGKFRSMCRNPFSGEQEYLGLFTTEMEAHKAWARRKLELAHELAAIQPDERIAKALVDRYTQYCV